MPRSWDADLQTIFKAYTRRDKLDVYLADGSTLKVSRGSRAGYDNWIRSVSDLTSTLDRSVDRVSFELQNVNSEVGFKLASDVRLLDYALATYAKQYQSLRNPSLVQDITFFRGVLADAEADETHVRMDMVVDYECTGAILASRGMGALCWWVYQNGIECTSTSGFDRCPRTREACAARGVEHEFGGWEFFDITSNTPPGGGIGGGYCFTLDTQVWLPSGDVPIGDLPLGEYSEPVKCVSFDPITGEICLDDEITQCWEHDAKGYFTFDFEDGRSFGVTPEHNIWIGFNRYRPADQWQLGYEARIHADGWERSKLVRIRWHSDEPAKVRNITTRRNHTYFANRIAVSNAKTPDIGGEI